MSQSTRVPDCMDQTKGDMHVLAMPGDALSQQGVPVNRLHRRDELHAGGALQVRRDSNVDREAVVRERGPMLEAYLVACVVYGHTLVMHKPGIGESCQLG